MQKLKTSTRREKVEQKEDAIVEAARRIFMEKGFAKTTMAEIARQSGVADGTVYLYFKNKEALARTVVSDFYRRLTERAQSGVDGLGSVQDQLRFLASHHMESIMNEHRILEMLPIVSAEIDSYRGSELFDLNKNYVIIFDRLVKVGQASGAVKSTVAPWILRDIFFGSMDYGFKTMMIGNRRKDISRFIDDLLGLIIVDTSKPNQHQGNGGALGNLADRFEAAASRLETMIEKSAG